jgi:hypothetical protein
MKEEPEKEKYKKIEDLITPQGLLVNGMGILPKKFDALIEKVDRNNFLTSMVEKKLEQIIELLNKMNNAM